MTINNQYPGYSTIGSFHDENTGQLCHVLAKDGRVAVVAETGVNNSCIKCTKTM